MDSIPDPCWRRAQRTAAWGVAGQRCYPRAMPPSKPKPPSPPSEPTFEERVAALEQVVRDLEGEDLSLERAIERYQEGVVHLTACRKLLDGAEQRLVELVQGPEGETLERPLEGSDRGHEPDEA